MGKINYVLGVLCLVFLFGMNSIYVKADEKVKTITFYEGDEKVDESQLKKIKLTYHYYDGSYDYTHIYLCMGRVPAWTACYNQPVDHDNDHYRFSHWEYVKDGQRIRVTDDTVFYADTDLYPVGTNLIDPDYSKVVEGIKKQQEEMTKAKELCIGIEDYKPEIQSVKTKRKKMTVKVTANYEQVNGYEIQYSTSNRFKKAKQKNVSSTKKSLRCTFRKLKKGSVYYVRVRAYAVYDQAKYTGDKTDKPRTYYSKWSKTKKVSIK